MTSRKIGRVSAPNLFEDFTHVKFYRRSLYDACVLEGATFDGFVHVDDWVPQRLVTATGQGDDLRRAGPASRR